MFLQQKSKPMGIIQWRDEVDKHAESVLCKSYKKVYISKKEFPSGHVYCTTNIFIALFIG
jgi:hypothetical protein